MLHKARATSGRRRVPHEGSRDAVARAARVRRLRSGLATCRPLGHLHSPMRSQADSLPDVIDVDAPTPFVVFGDDWGRHVSTTQHIFRRLAREHPVVWLNAINHRTPKLSLYDARRAAAKMGSMLRTRVATAASRSDAITSGEVDDVQLASIVPPRILPWHNVTAIRYLNTRSVLRDLRTALQRGEQRRRPVLVTATPAIPDVVRQLDAEVKIYFCLDDYAEIQGVDKELVLPLERETLGAVDAVIATAQALVTSKRPTTGRGYYLPQGVNYDHFCRPQPLPPELAAIPRPRVGFAGNLATVCDLDLLRSIALSHPDWSLVLVGPVSVDASSLALPNVHVLGNRPYGALPAYVQGFDVGIIPYVLNAWTRAVDPLKTLEYLAAGIPVVSLPLPEIYKYAPPVRVAEGSEAFATAIAAALAEPAAATDARRALAREHTWERRASRFLEIVRELRGECVAS